jgi:hypothetical protein
MNNLLLQRVDVQAVRNFNREIKFLLNFSETDELK